MKKSLVLLPLLLAGQTMLTPVAAWSSDSSMNALLNMSLAELVDIEVTSVSKRAEKASEAAAAIFVITQEDIQRSGVTSIPEALRLAPGIQVARTGSHQWAISARGLNDQFANKLLVLIDGRSVYNPLFGGVWWDAQGALLEDVERIEVIRGPGATLWGANAVNGVINVITRHSDETIGNLAALTAGNQEQIASYRHGGELENGAYRFYGQYTRDDETDFPGGTGADDDWSVFQAGFRSDLNLSDRGRVTVQGDVYSGEEGTLLTLPSFSSPTLTSNLMDGQMMRGANILGRWDKRVGDDSAIQLQVYADHTKRDDTFLEQSVNTLDIDFQHSWNAAENHEVIWGAGYRYIYDNLKGNIVSFAPDSRGYDLWSAFLQDKITLLPEELFFTIGTKLEHNDFSGSEVQPSARLSWLVDDRQTFWASVSRSVRTPLRVSDDVNYASKVVPTPLGLGVVTLQASSDLDAETSIAYEAGYRVQPTESLSFDLAAFYNDYDKLFAESAATPFLGTSAAFGTHIVVPYTLKNSGSGKSYGAEFVANWSVVPRWSLSSSYSFLKLDLDSASTFFATESESPNHQFNLRSHYAFSEALSWDTGLYYMDAIQAGANAIPDYFRLDSRLNWQISDGLEFSLVGQNLLDDRHVEFEPFILESSVKEIGRSVYGKITWRY